MSEGYYGSLMGLTNQQLLELSVLAGLKVSYAEKGKKPYVDALEDYCAKRCKTIWKRLDGFEKELVGICALSDGLPDKDALNKLLKKWEFDEFQTERIPHLWTYLRKDSKVRLMLPNGKLPTELCDIVKMDLFFEKANVPEPLQPNPAEKAVSREDRIFELRLLLDAISNSSPHSFSPVNYALMLMQKVGLEDVVFKNGLLCDPKWAESLCDMKVAGALLLAINGYSSTMNFLKDEDLAKQLFSRYLSTYSGEDRLCRFTLKSDHNLNVARHILVSALKKLPVGQKIDFAPLLEVCVKHGFLRGTDPAVISQNEMTVFETWKTVQETYACIMLSCLCALGMVDLVWSEKLTVGGRETVKSLAVTELGQYIMEVQTKPYVPKDPPGKVIVSPDFTVTIQPPVRPILGKYPHDTLLTNIGDGKYALDFNAFVKMLSYGVPQAEIKSLFKSSPLPENVSETIDRWISKIATAKTRQAYVIETDDVYLLAEILNRLGDMAEPMDEYEIDPDQIKELETSARHMESLIRINN
ncbi:MAG: hypothetical protein LBT59_26225 [Clostridiales bacterium]|jgi:hypothetical protein|nr:hypothetical protein [Clostridiales bacterium]